MVKLTFSKLKPKEKELLKAAEKALKHAYNPYSHSFVGAAVLTQSGEIISAGSMANMSTSVNLCAERCAVAAANAKGHRHIIKLALIAKAEDHDYEEPVTPCGICRQFLYEIDMITEGELDIICSNTKKTIIYKFTLSELLPYPYSRYKKPLK